MPIDRTRNNLVEEALKEGCTYVFFLDSDIILEPDSVLKLLSYRFPITSGVYPDRGGRGNAWKDGKNYWIEKGAMVVDECGMGCCLVDSRVFEKVPYPWFTYDYDRLRAPNAPSEDIAFCRKAASAHGFKPLVVGEVRARHSFTGALVSPKRIEHLAI